MLEKIKQILRLILGILVVIFLGWLAITFRVNIGGLLRKLFNTSDPEKKATVKSKDKVVGKVVDIYMDSNPFRDKTILKTTEGEEIKLPKGVKDNNVKKLIKIGTDYTVELKHEKLTKVLD